jgi:hypothetical protein
MSAAKLIGALAIAVGAVLSSIGLYWAHQASAIRRAAYVSSADIKDFSIGPYASRGMAFIGIGVVMLVAGIISVGQGRRSS